MGISQQIGASSLSKPGVCTSSTRPATPYEGQMIYETDTDKVLVWNGSAWYANWNTAWGIVGIATSATNQSSIAAEVLTTGMSVTFTAIANRYYEITYFENAPYKSTSPTVIVFRIRQTNLVGTLLLASCVRYESTGQNSMFNGSLVKTFTAGSVTLVGTAQCGTGLASLERAFESSPVGAHLLVKDIGPV